MYYFNILFNVKREVKWDAFGQYFIKPFPSYFDRLGTCMSVNFTGMVKNGSFFWDDKKFK